MSKASLQGWGAEGRLSMRAAALAIALGVIGLAHGGELPPLTWADKVMGTIIAFMTLPSLCAYLLAVAVLFNASNVRASLSHRDRRSVTAGRVVGFTAALGLAIYIKTLYPHLGESPAPGSEGQYLAGARMSRFVVELAASLPGAYLVVASLTRVISEKLVFRRRKELPPASATEERAPAFPEAPPPGSELEALWRRKTAEELGQALRSLQDFTEEARAIINAEAKRRGLTVD
jgi:hypothetical protein